MRERGRYGVDFARGIILGDIAKQGIQATAKAALGTTGREITHAASFSIFGKRRISSRASAM